MTRLKKGLSYIGMFLVPIIIFYLTELYNHTPWKTMNGNAQMLNIVFFELLMLLLFFITGRAKLALRIELVFFACAGLANYYVMSFRSIPILPWDFYSVKTAASVAGDFSYKLPWQIIMLILVFIGLTFCLKWLKVSIPKKFWIARIIGVVIVLVLMGGFVSKLHQESFLAKKGIYDKLFTPVAMYEKDGLAVTFLIDVQYISVKKPEGYSAQDSKELLNKYNAKSEVTASTAEKQQNRPNVIVIMNEAFSDLAVLGDFKTNEDYMPYFHSLEEGAENTVTGKLNVSVLGGNTANTEFEFLTGDTMQFLPDGSIPYQQYVKKETPTLATYLGDLGYSTLAMHPYYATGWDRNKVYPLFAFDKMMFREDFQNQKVIRNYVSDECCYENIITQYEQKDKNQPMFIFNVTMQNHGSYSERYENLPLEISVEGSDSEVLSTYLTLIKDSDIALQKLTKYFSEQDEDTIIVMFGDHQPANSVVSDIWKINGTKSSQLTEEQQNNRYKVPFVIWANYDIEEEKGIETSVNYLSGLVLEKAGIPLDGYQVFLKELQQDVPVISARRITNSDGNSVSFDEMKDTLVTYEKLQYYQLFDSEK